MLTKNVDIVVLTNGITGRGSRFEGLRPHKLAVVSHLNLASNSQVTCGSCVETGNLDCTVPHISPSVSESSPNIMNNVRHA
jgi:hypothetical protein